MGTIANHEAIHDLTLVHGEMDYLLQFLSPIVRRLRHSRMFLAGIQAEFGLDPRLKHSGVTVLRVHLLTPSRIFKGAYRARKVSKMVSKFRVLHERYYGGLRFSF
jgi:hypothetical protein